jgi:hypothetical protein
MNEGRLRRRDRGNRVVSSIAGAALKPLIQDAKKAIVEEGGASVVVEL